MARPSDVVAGSSDVIEGARAGIERSPNGAGVAPGAIAGAPELVDDGDEIWAEQREGQRDREGAVVRVSTIRSRLPEVLRVADRLGAGVVGRAAYGVLWLRLDAAPENELAAGVATIRRELDPDPCVLLDAPEGLRRRLDAFDIGRLAERGLMRAVRVRFDPEGACNPGLMGEAI